MSAHVRNEEVKARLSAIYDDLFAHDGFSELRVEIRLLKRGQKEVILHCGRQYRFVVDYPELANGKRKEDTRVYGTPS
ncbi:MAG: hypothetical protein NNA31_10680 [Nitrospira sp.]|nr:hypothetical protein [Nitrospira sp.]